MKRIVVAAAIATLAAIGAAGVPGSAATKEAGIQETGISTTLSAHRRHWRHGHHYGWYRGHHRGWRSHYAAAGCRVVVRSHINRFGERVVVRSRIC